MDSPKDKSPFSATEQCSGAQTLDPPGLSNLPEIAHPVRTDRLYQIAALTAGRLASVTSAISASE